VAQLLAIASLALFVVLVVAFAYVLRRTAQVVSVTREDDGFRRDAAALADRTASAIGESAKPIDRVRRRQDPPASLNEVLPGLLETLAGLRVEAGVLRPPASLAPLGERLAQEIERATRAVETVEHGCAMLSNLAARPREAEGETSVKRGYLNLLHAQEALLSLAVDLRSGRSSAARWFSDRRAVD
jgi:hypothetical protein